MLDLRPLYDVQERLEHAAVAGTGILNEDFRLKRAQEGLAPLAAASPVFAKIHAGLETLLTVPPEKRGGTLPEVRPWHAGWRSWHAPRALSPTK